MACGVTKWKIKMHKLKRCDWVQLQKPYQIIYHDEEWGIPVYDDLKHFEILILEIFQAGLSWDLILRKRNYLKAAFEKFNPVLLSEKPDDFFEKLMQDSNMIRNRKKIWCVRTNAQAFLKIQKNFGTFSSFMWSYIDNKQIVNHWTNSNQIPAKNELSIKISRNLKELGLQFIGPTVIYSYMQATGMINDHVMSCWKK